MTEFQEFAGAPLALGSVHGVRQWNADSLGRLIGLTYPKVWTPGENVAECTRTKRDPDCKGKDCVLKHSNPHELIWPSFIMGSNNTITVQPSSPHCTVPDPCSGADPSCKCGFWAYYDGAHWNERSIARGVIEGYGPTTVGTKGFRAHKARILALTLSAKKRDREAAALIRRNYPGVAFYDDYADMLAAYPLVQANIPTPDTDPEFWTRPADKPVEPPSHLYAQGGLIS